MRVPIQMMVYEKPQIAFTSGDRFIKRHLTYNYKHTIASFGWFDTASCELVADRSEAQQIFQEYPGCRVAFFADNPMMPIWEGFIERVEIDTGNVKLGRGLTEMSNSINVKYFDTASSPNTKLTAKVDNTVSQAIYGVKMGAYDAGVFYTGGGGSETTHLKNKLLALHAHPFTSMQASSSQNVTIKLFFNGFYHTLDWETFETSDTATDVASNVIFGFAWYWAAHPTLALYNRDVFYSSTDYQATHEANTAFSISFEKKGGTSHLQKIREITESGGLDGSTYVDYVFGITPTIPSLGYRRAYYRKANTEVKYIVKAYGDPGLFSVNGLKVRPWIVTPDCVVQASDLLPSWNGVGTDPRLGYITQVTWDSNQDYVAWQTKDNRMTSMTGAFQLDRANKQIGTNFGPPRPDMYY